jgi:hypothetical protein
VNRIIKARPLDNLEFAQWMKHYYDTATGGVGVAAYNAEERREVAKGAGAAAVKKRAFPRAAGLLLRMDVCACMLRVLTSACCVCALQGRRLRLRRGRRAPPRRRA